jgi:hypothetical protein
MLSLTNMLTYYSMIAVFGTVLGLVAMFAALQGHNLAMFRTWLGFYGESFSNWQSLLIILSIVLTGVTPVYLATLLWNQHPLATEVQEAEVMWVSTDQPVFYSPPKADDIHRDSDSQVRSPSLAEPEFRLPSPR